MYSMAIYVEGNIWCVYVCMHAMCVYVHVCTMLPYVCIYMDVYTNICI